MRIRGRKLPADHYVSSSPSPSPSPSSSSHSSSITASSSLASSQDSSSPFSVVETSSHRCQGLDLLVKAIHQVTAGSAVGVPYIQRRVIIRRRRRTTCALHLDQLFHRKKQNKPNKTRNNTRPTNMQSRLQDSVLYHNFM